MKQKLKQNIIHRLECVTKLLTNTSYDPVRDGFFKPVLMAFFIGKVT